MPHPPKAVLFDVGNTLLMLDHAAIVAAVGEGLTHAHLEQAEPAMWHRLNDRLMQQANGGERVAVLRLILTSLLAHAPLPDPEPAIQRLVLENRRLSLWRRVNGAAKDVVAELRRRGYRTGIISNADGKLAELLRLTGWLDAFEAIFDSALLGAEKPAVEIFERAAHAMSLHPSEALYVGDLPAVDIVGAANAGLRPILYDSHRVFAREADLLARTLGTPVARITHMEELFSLLD